jgi:hypothetical protein
MSRWEINTKINTGIMENGCEDVRLWSLLMCSFRYTKCQGISWASNWCTDFSRKILYHEISWTSNDKRLLKQAHNKNIILASVITNCVARWEHMTTICKLTCSWVNCTDVTECQMQNDSMSNVRDACPQLQERTETENVWEMSPDDYYVWASNLHSSHSIVMIIN